MPESKWKINRVALRDKSAAGFIVSAIATIDLLIDRGSFPSTASILGEPRDTPRRFGVKVVCCHRRGKPPLIAGGAKCESGLSIDSIDLPRNTR